MTTLTTVPALPVPGRQVLLKFGLSESAATFVRVWVTSAPDGSDEAEKLAKTTEDRVLIYEDRGGSSAQDTRTFAVAGNYNLVAQEYTKGVSTHGGTYANDPNRYRTETAVGGETSITISVGQKVAIRLGVGADTASLEMFVWNDTVNATTLEAHGEVTPTIVSPTTPKARIAALESNVVAGVDALAGQTAATIAGNPNTVLSNLIQKYEAHRASAVFHSAADTLNTVDASFDGATGTQALIAGSNELTQKLDYHFRNAEPTDTSTGAQAYHAPTTKIADFANAAIASPAGDALTATAQVADLWRAYDAHRQSTSVHNPADTTNVPDALPPLMDIHRYFFDSLRQQSPTAPATEQSGAVRLVQTYGATEE